MYKSENLIKKYSSVGKFSTFESELDLEDKK